MRVVPLVAAGAVLEGARSGREQGRRGQPECCKDKASPGHGAPGPGAAAAPGAAPRRVPGGREASPAPLTVRGEQAEPQHLPRRGRAGVGGESAVHGGAERGTPAGRGEGSAAGQAGQARGGPADTAGGRPVPLPRRSGVGPGRWHKAGAAEAGVPSRVGVPPPLRATCVRESLPAQRKCVFLRLTIFSPCFSFCAGRCSRRCTPSLGITRRAWLCLICSLSGVCTRQ